MKLFRRFFPDRQMRELMRALDDLLPVFSGRGGPLGSSLAFDDIAKRTRAMLMENPNLAKASLGDDFHTHRNACLVVIAAVVWEDLTAGTDHVYRGKLSMVGTSKLNIYNLAMAELEKARVCTTEVRKLRAQELAECIREVG